MENFKLNSKNHKLQNNLADRLDILELQHESAKKIQRQWRKYIVKSLIL